MWVTFADASRTKAVTDKVFISPAVAEGATSAKPVIFLWSARLLAADGPALGAEAFLSETNARRQARMELSSRVRRKSATCCTNAMISGCGLCSLDESCGWNNVAM